MSTGNFDWEDYKYYTLAARATLFPDKSREEVLEILEDLKEQWLAIYTKPKPESGFRRELQDLINMHSMENGSDTPDFILAEYLDNCLKAFDTATAAREKWYGREIRSTEPPIDPHPFPSIEEAPADDWNEDDWKQKVVDNPDVRNYNFDPRVF